MAVLYSTLPMSHFVYIVLILLLLLQSTLNTTAQIFNLCDTRDSEQTLFSSSPFFIHRGLIAEKPDDSLFFVDTGEKDKDTQPRKYEKSSLYILCHCFFLFNP